MDKISIRKIQLPLVLIGVVIFVVLLLVLPFIISPSMEVIKQELPVSFFSQ